MLQSIYNYSIIQALVNWEGWQVLIWFSIIEALSFAVMPLFMSICRGLPDKGYGLSKAGGIFLFGILSWWIGLSHIIPANPVVIRLLFILTIVPAYLYFKRNNERRTELFEIVNRHGLAVETAFLLITTIYLLVRFFNAEIFWGEKPMDSTFLRYFIREGTLPPQDPWSAGNPMNYYYLGTFILAAIHKVGAINPGIGYNLSIATLAGLIASGLYSILLNFTSRCWVAFVMSSLFIFSSNFESFRLWFYESKTGTFDDLFWPSTRFFTSPAFSEYTVWSLLFADLHAHVIAIPFTILFVGLASSLFIYPAERFSRHGLVLRLLCGLVLGSFIPINTWDFFTWGFLCGVLLLFAPYKRFWKPPLTPSGRLLFRERLFVEIVPRIPGWIWDAGLVGIGVLMSGLPWVLTSSGSHGLWWGWAVASEYNSVQQLLRMNGGWFSLALLALVGLTFSACCKKDSESKSLIFFLSRTAISLLAIGLFVYFTTTSERPWGVVGLCVGLVLLGNLLLSARENPLKFVGIFLIAAGNLTVAAEHTFLMDRMNTIFKTYSSLWTMYGIVACSLLCIVLSRPVNGFKKFLRAAVCILAFIIALPGLIGTAFNIHAVLAMQRVNGRTPTLDGTKYLWVSDPEDAALASWINTNIKGTPTMLEAQGISYGPFTRISMHTGLPTLLGWDYHVKQRGTLDRDIDERKIAIQRIYSVPDNQAIDDLLLTYGIELIVIGPLERQTYPAGGLAKFENDPVRYPKLFESGNSMIVATPYSTLNLRRASKMKVSGGN